MSRVRVFRNKGSGWRCPILALASVLVTPATHYAQWSEWTATQEDGVVFGNVFQWGGADSIWTFDSALVRSTGAPTSTALDIEGGSIVPSRSLREIRRPIDAPIWTGVMVGGVAGGAFDIAIATLSDAFPEGYVPGLLTLTGAGLGALIAVLYGTDEVYRISEMDDNDRRITIDRRLPMARSVDASHQVVTFDNASPPTRRISWTSWWINGTLGWAGNASERFGPSFGFTGGYAWRNHVGLFDYAAWGRDQEFGSVALLYGRLYESQGGAIVTSIGPGVTWSAPSSFSGRETYTLPSLVGRAAIAWPATPWVGFGASLFAGVNNRVAFGGFHLAYYLGDLD